MSLRKPPLVPVLVLGTLMLGSACKKEEEVPTLFDEDGVWSLVRHDALATGLIADVDTMTRRDAFLLRYHADSNVVETAMCGETATDTPADSICLISANATWQFCNCFGYAFERSQQIWQEFQAGDMPPDVSFDESSDEADGASATATGTDGATGGDPPPGDATTINLAEVQQVADTYQYRPLPMGIFGSDGLASAYVFQQKAPQLWDMVECAPCI